MQFSLVIIAESGVSVSSHGRTSRDESQLGASPIATQTSPTRKQTGMLTTNYHQHGQMKI